MKINRQEIFDKLGGKCAYCGVELESIKNMQIDHILSQRNFEWHIKNNFGIPDFLIGVTNVNDDKNLFPSCRSCNLYKSSMFLENFRKEVELQVERLNKQPMYKLAKRFGLIKDKPQKIKFYFETI